MTKARDLANIISGGFDATDIPNLDTAKITSGTFADARLPATALNSNVDLTNLSASNLTSGTIPTARITALPSGVGGKILQIVSGTHATETGSSSGSYVDTGLDVLITPTATSSKIFVTCTFGTHNNGASRTQYYTLYRGSTNLHSSNGSGFFSTYADGGSSSQSGAINFLDSPNTTSQIEYSLYMKADAGSAYISLHGSTSTITVMEIEA